MRSRLAGIQITPPKTAQNTNETPIVILDQQIEKALSNISADKQQAAREFCCIRIAQKLKKASVLNYIKAIATLEPLKKDYRQITKQDMIAWASLIDKHYATATAQLYRVLVKNFIRWAYYGDSEDPEYPECVSWIKTRKLKEPYKKPILNKKDLYLQINQAKSQRDRALLLCLYESGCRAGELLGLRIKDITITQNAAEIRVDGKTGPREIFLVECVPDLQLWLNIHPHSEDPECPLWPADGDGKKGITYNTLFWLVQHLARKAGLPKGISPHSFRHASVTYKSEILNESQLRLYYGWEKDSKMPTRYTHPGEKTLRDRIRESYGLAPEEGQRENLPTLPKECPRCRHSNSTLAKFCMRCGIALDVKTATETLKLGTRMDNLMDGVLQELMKQAPDLLRKIVDEKIQGGGFNL